ncbi:hypothetical protein DMH88_10730 [Escherichia coli]|nr:hypothetical protein [Escherichia coli]
MPAVWSEGEKKTRASFYFFGASSGLFTPLQDVAKFREGVSKEFNRGKKTDAHWRRLWQDVS